MRAVRSRRAGRAHCWPGSRSGRAPSRAPPSLPLSGPTFSTTARAPACAARCGRCAARSARTRSSRLATGRPRARHVGRRPRGRAPPRRRARPTRRSRSSRRLPPRARRGVGARGAGRAPRPSRLIARGAGVRGRHGTASCGGGCADRRQAALEPLSEEIHRALMRRLDAAGDRGAALAEYTELRTGSSPASGPGRPGDAAARRSAPRRSCRCDADRVSGAPAPRRPGGVRRPHHRAGPHRGRLAARHRRRGRRPGRPARRRGGDREVADHGALRGRGERGGSDRALRRVRGAVAHSVCPLLGGDRRQGPRA